MAINELCNQLLFRMTGIVLTVFTLIFAVTRQKMTHYFRDAKDIIRPLSAIDPKGLNSNMTIRL